MNKHIHFVIYLQFFLTPALILSYKISKIPHELHNKYKVTYQLETNKFIDPEEGLLEETITKIPQSFNDKVTHKISYRYNQIKRTNNKSQPNQFENDLFCNDSLDIIECTDCHPIIFYLHNIHSGIKTEFFCERDEWDCYLADNKHTYLDHSSSTKYEKDVRVHYKVCKIEQPNKLFSPLVPIEGLEDFEDLGNTNLDYKYTIAWNALNFWGSSSRRQGEIEIDSNGILHSLVVKLPHQLQQFSISDTKKLDQSITLFIKRIDKKPTS